MGDQYLRRLLIVGMTSLVRRNLHRPDAADPRITALLARKQNGTSSAQTIKASGP